MPMYLDENGLQIMCEKLKGKVTTATLPSDFDPEEIEPNSLCVTKEYQDLETGDIIIWDGEKFIAVKATNLSNYTYNANTFCPIGVVCIPTKHNVYGNYDALMVSLKYNAIATPDSGTISSSSGVAMYFGSPKDLIDGVVSVPSGGSKVPVMDSTTGKVKSVARYAYSPSDVNVAETRDDICSGDENTGYASNAGANHSPSPYFTDGSRNTNYIDTSKGDHDLVNFNGYEMSQTYWNDIIAVENWKTVSSFTNSYAEGSYPAFMCCWRYHTVGTNQGEWYLPSLAEMGYISARTALFNNTIRPAVNSWAGTTVMTQYPTSANYFWTATPDSKTASSASQRCITRSNGRLVANNRTVNSRSIAVHRIRI